MKELVSVMGEQVLGEILSRVKKSKYYSISLDSIPDAAHCPTSPCIEIHGERWPSGTLCNIHGLAYSSSVISEDPECLLTSIITGSATMKIVNFYVPPGKVYSSDQMELILNHSSECLIYGDLNARSPMFGPCLSDSRGKIVEELTHKNNLVALNTGMGTHLAPNGSSSVIDVALASPNKALKSTWKVLDQNLGSDHFVIQIVINEPVFREEIRLPSINMKNVNWNSFQLRCLKTLHQALPSVDLEDNTNYVTASILQAVKLSSPAKKECWQSFCSRLNRNTDLGKLWRTIKSMNGTTLNSQIPPIASESGIPLDNLGKAETLADTFALASSNANLSPNFAQIKNSFTLTPEIFQPDLYDSSLSDPISVTEIHEALQKCGNSSPGPDGIQYDMLRKLPYSSLEGVLSLLNQSWLSGWVPSSWKKATVIPIPKKRQTLFCALLSQTYIPDLHPLQTP